MSRSEVDMELKKAFAAQQHMVIETRQRLKLVDLKSDVLKSTIYKSKLVDREMASLPDDTKTYESVGRMFVVKSITDIRDSLTKQVTSCEEKIKTLESSKAHMERSLKDSENNLREMVQQRKDMVSVSD